MRLPARGAAGGSCLRWVSKLSDVAVTATPQNRDSGLVGVSLPVTDFRASPYPYPQQVSKVNSL